MKYQSPRAADSSRTGETRRYLLPPFPCQGKGAGGPRRPRTRRTARIWPLGCGPRPPVPGMGINGHLPALRSVATEKIQQYPRLQGEWW